MKRGYVVLELFPNAAILRGVVVRYEESALHIGSPNQSAVLLGSDPLNPTSEGSIKCSLVRCCGNHICLIKHSLPVI